MSHSALSPTSLEFMTILERQLAAQENQQAGDDNGTDGDSVNPFSPNAYYSYLSPGPDSGNVNNQNQNQNQNQSFNPQDVPLTPEILNAFLQGLNSAGFSKQEILDFSANQIGQLQEPLASPSGQRGGQQPQPQPQPQPQMQSHQPLQQQQQQQRGFVNPVLTGGKGNFGAFSALNGNNIGLNTAGFNPLGNSRNLGSNGNDNQNNLMAMMMTMNRNISNSTNYMNATGDNVIVNPPNGSYPQPGVHTPEASASSKDSALGSNTSSPGSNVGMPTRMPSASSSGGANENQKSARSRRASQSGRARETEDSGDKHDHKRKAEEEELIGHQSLRRHMGEDDSSAEDHSDVPTAGNSKRGGVKKETASSRRKSTSGNAQASREESDAQAKALKRKNQNRAAQKAFRERREQRVKDLEDRVAELEANNAGQTFENDNLRQLLSKLQKENMALKEHKFTFNMPVPGARASEPAASGPARSTSTSATPAMSVDKMPSPSASSINGQDKTRDPTPGSVRSNTDTSTSNYDSPRSAFSGSDAISPASRPGTSGPENVFFNAEPYNAFANGGTKTNGASAYAPWASAAEQAGAMANVDLQALLNAFKVQYGQPQTPGVQVQPSPAVPQSNAYRDVNAGEVTGDPLGNEFDLAGNVSLDDLFGNDQAMNDFWKSLNQPEPIDLTGLADDPLVSNNQFADSHGSVSPVDAATDAGSWPQGTLNGRPGHPDLDALRSDSCGSANGQGGSVSGASADAAFSPNKYLTMSPDSAVVENSPLDSMGGKVPSPCQFLMGGGMALSTLGQTDPEQKHLSGAGRMMSTMEAWNSVSSKIDLSNGFDLDDLCDSFKKKAKCDGTGPMISQVEVDKIVDDYSKRRQLAQ